MNNNVKNEKGIGLGIIIILVLIILMILPFSLGFELGPVKKGPAAILVGIYLQFWGILFLLSYFFAHKTFFLRGLIWICENFSSPKGRKMAFFYFALAFGLGTAGLIQGLGLFSENIGTTSYGMKHIELENIPPQVSDYSANESFQTLNNIMLSTSFENLEISNPGKIVPFLNMGNEKWQVNDEHVRSGRYCLNIIPDGNIASKFSSIFHSFSEKDRNYAILNSQFSDTYKPFDISKFDLVELEFWRYSTSNPDRRDEFNCGSTLDIYYRIDNGEWKHKMSFCGQHKSETTGWRQSNLQFITKGHRAIEFKFVYHIVVPKNDPEVFYLIDDLRLVGNIE